MTKQHMKLIIYLIIISISTAAFLLTRFSNLENYSILQINALIIGYSTLALLSVVVGAISFKCYLKAKRIHRNTTLTLLPSLQRLMFV